MLTHTVENYTIQNCRLRMGTYTFNIVIEFCAEGQNPKDVFCVAECARDDTGSGFITFALSRCYEHWVTNDDDDLTKTMDNLLVMEILIVFTVHINSVAAQNGNQFSFNSYVSSDRTCQGADICAGWFHVGWFQIYNLFCRSQQVVPISFVYMLVWIVF